jgi:Plasmid maintenance system antidote protein
MNGIGKYIESLIKKVGHSQSYIARTIGIHRQSLSYVIAGRRELSISLALKLESFFNLREGELMKIQTEESVRNYKQKHKRKLVEKLLNANAFWSYTHVSADNITGEELIEKTFITLDISDIALLFELYSRDYILKVWRNSMVVQGDYLFDLNVMIALYYFDIKKPEKYLRRVEKKQLKQLYNA